MIACETVPYIISVLDFEGNAYCLLTIAQDSTVDIIIKHKKY